jgi:hypothetical protein
LAAATVGNTGRAELWYSTGIKGGSSNAVTVALSTSSKAAVRAEEFGGVPASAVLQQVNGNASTAPGAVATTKTVTTSIPGTYLIADIGWDSAATASLTTGGFVRIGQLSNADASATICYLFAKANVSGTFGTGVTLSSSSNWQSVIAALSVPTPTPTP